MTTTVTRDVLPRKVSLTFATNPAGRQVVVAGAAYTAPDDAGLLGGAHDRRRRARRRPTARATRGSSRPGPTAARPHIRSRRRLRRRPTPRRSSAARLRRAGGGVWARTGLGVGSGRLVGDAGTAGTVVGCDLERCGPVRVGVELRRGERLGDGGGCGVARLSSGMTLEAWVRPSRLGGWRTVVFKERSGGVVYGLYGDQAGGRPLGQVDIGGERNAVGSASLPLNAGRTWRRRSTVLSCVCM